MPGEKHRSKHQSSSWDSCNGSRLVLWSPTPNTSQSIPDRCRPYGERGTHWMSTMFQVTNVQSCLPKSTCRLFRTTLRFFTRESTGTRKLNCSADGANAALRDRSYFVSWNILMRIKHHSAPDHECTSRCERQNYLLSNLLSWVSMKFKYKQMAVAFAWASCGAVHGNTYIRQVTESSGCRLWGWKNSLKLAALGSSPSSSRQSGSLDTPHGARGECNTTRSAGSGVSEYLSAGRASLRWVQENEPLFSGFIRWGEQIKTKSDRNTYYGKASFPVWRHLVLEKKVQCSLLKRRRIASNAGWKNVSGFPANQRSTSMRKRNSMCQTQCIPCKFIQAIEAKCKPSKNTCNAVSALAVKRTAPKLGGRNRDVIHCNETDSALAFTFFWFIATTFTFHCRQSKWHELLIKK